MPLSCPHCLALKTVEKLFVLPWCDAILAAVNVTVALAAAAWALFVLLTPKMSSAADGKLWPTEIVDGGAFTIAAAKAAAQGGVPVVFRSALSSDGLAWKARGKWTPSWLSTEVPFFRGATVFREGAGGFWYVDSARLELWPSFSSEDERGLNSGRLKVDIESSSFWELCRLGEHAWHSSTLAMEGDGVPADVDPVDPLLVSSSSSNGSLASANAWFGCAGVTTKLHRDLSHNWFVQLFGRKRFRLAPVEASPGIPRHMYPYTHPLHVHPAGLGLDAEEKKCTIAGIDIVLSPGDALYIPPMTLHEVTAMSDEGTDGNASISVNVWSRSDEEEAAAAIGGSRVLLPFDEDWKGDFMASAVLTYLGEVFASQEAWTQWRESRWLHLGLERTAGVRTLFASRPELLHEQRERFKVRAGKLRSVLSSLVPDPARSRELLFDFADELATFGCGAITEGLHEDQRGGKSVSACLDAWDDKKWS